MKILLITIVVFIFFNQVKTFPVSYNNNFDPTVRFVPIRVLQQYPGSSPGEQPKQVWNAIGNFIQSTGFLPIEINVPDTITAISNGAQNFYTGLSTGISTVAGNVIQRIPFLHRITRPERPRPFYKPVMVLVPAQMGGQVADFQNWGTQVDQLNYGGDGGFIEVVNN